MEFFIRQGSSNPMLKLQLIDDGKFDMTAFNDKLENAVIRFEMSDSTTNEPFILDAPCYITTRNELYKQTSTSYFIIYNFTCEQTSRIGKYEGKITVFFRDTDLNYTGNLILPVREKLYINIF
jgi:hypothetical protein